MALLVMISLPSAIYMLHLQEVCGGEYCTMIEHWDEKIDGELNEANMRAKLEARGYLVNCYTYPPSTVFPEHTHEIDKIGGALSGQFRVTINGEPLTLVAGDCLVVPRGALHSAEVVGSATVISLDAVKI